MKNQIFAYMRISTNKITQKTDRQESTIKAYSNENGFEIDKWYSDVITGATNADNRPDYSNLKAVLRDGDILIICDIDRLGRNADDVIRELKELKALGIRVIALDVPYMNDWEKALDNSLYDMIIDIFITLKAHMAQQEKEKNHERIKQGLKATKEKGTKLGRPSSDVPESFIKEYDKFINGGYGKMTSVQFSKFIGIGRSTFYKYKNIIETTPINEKNA